MEYAIGLFVVVFVLVLVQTVGVISAVESRYALTFLMYVATSILWVLNLKILNAGSYSNLLIAMDALATGSGAVLGIYLHKRFLKDKQNPPRL